ncbi:MAG: hypothetical protein ACP5HQ_06340 [Thermoprotei archaeon]
MSYAEEVFKPNIVLVSVTDLETEVKSLKAEVEKVKDDNRRAHDDIVKRIEALEKSVSWLTVVRSQAIWKSKTCRYANNGICDAWNVSEPDKVGVPNDAVVAVDGPYKKVNLNKFPEICAVCPLYEMKK